MDYFNLPKRTSVNRVVPKNAFDAHTNTKQKKLFTDKIRRITWTHKLSAETINLEGEDIQELQIFKVELKQKDMISSLLDLIDKTIPYPIIFWVEYEEQVYLSTAVKHLHPVKENVSVIDWTFATKWLDDSEKMTYQLNLSKTLDAVHKDFCLQIAGQPAWKSKPIAAIVQHQQEISALEKEIQQLKLKIKKCRQFKEKVALNMVLKEKEAELRRMTSMPDIKLT